MTELSQEELASQVEAELASKSGMQSQSMLPARDTSAQTRESPISA